MPEMAKGLTSRDLLSWRAYFQVAHDLAAEIAAAPPRSFEPRAPARAPRHMNEAQMDAFFRAHARRFAQQAN